MRAMGVLKRQESGKNYTILFDPTTAIERVYTDRLGPGQALAKATTLRATDILRLREIGRALLLSPTGHHESKQKQDPHYKHHTILDD